MSAATTLVKEINIEQALASDLNAIKDLLAKSELPNADITAEHLDHFTVVRSGERIIGAIGLESYGRFALLRSFAVAPEFRNFGMGARLVRHAEQNAQRLSVQRLFLLTTTAERFFLKHGYEKTNRDAAPEAIRTTTEFRDICPSSAVCMSKMPNSE